MLGGFAAFAKDVGSVSVIVALFGRDAIALGADRRCIGPDGSVRDTYNKAFTFADFAAIGAYVGLMESDGIPFGEVMRAFKGTDARTLDDLATAVGDHVSAILAAIPETEVALEHRGTTIMLAARHGLDGFAPNESKEQLVLTKRAHDSGHWFCGNAAAQRAARHYVEGRKKHCGTLRRKLVAALAHDALAEGIARASPEAAHPQIISCGGAPNVVTI
jgi:hypothetical protein